VFYSTIRLTYKASLDKDYNIPQIEARWDLFFVEPILDTSSLRICMELGNPITNAI
jgi:hypothetical protein